MLNKNPYLSFDFSNANGDRDMFDFINPIEVIVANHIDEVIPALNKIEKATDDGFYAAGYLSYEAAPAFNNQFLVHETSDMPLLWFGIFKEPQIEQKVSENKPFHLTDWKPNIPTKKYNDSIDKIHDYIRSGKTSQVNYTLQMDAQFSGDSFSFYKQLKEAQSNYSAFLDLGKFTILSASPELFFHLNNQTITTKPMKGTAERGLTFEQDIKNAEWLANSEKNRLENKMVVDLMKVELEEIATEDSIHLASAYDVEKYPTVYQMTSTINAELAQDKTITNIFEALFPCGSITGSPKINTMDIIKELEVNSREVYCGAIGFITPEKRATFNVPIRTVYINNETNEAKYGVGGAITIDSTKEEEYKEILTKANILTKKSETFELLETIGLSDGEFIVLDEHFARLKQSATYFDFAINLDSIKKNLKDIAAQQPTGTYKVRLTMTKDGKFSSKIEEIYPMTDIQTVQLANEPINKENLFLYHKTTNREMYEPFSTSGTFDTLLWNDEKEVTEFTIGNIVAEKDGTFYTPPVSSGLLPGTFRQSLLNSGKIQEKTIKVSDLNTYDSLWFINSVRQWVRVKLA